MFLQNKLITTVPDFQMNQNCIYHSGNMTMVRTDFHIGEQLFGMTYLEGLTSKTPNHVTVSNTWLNPAFLKT